MLALLTRGVGFGDTACDARYHRRGLQGVIANDHRKRRIAFRTHRRPGAFASGLDFMAIAPMNVESHEIVVSFARAGWPLHPTLCEMLDEHPVHRTERRGCGYTQASRFLSTFVNRPRDPIDSFDFGIFAEWPKQLTESLARIASAAGWHQGWRRLDRCSLQIHRDLSPRSLAEALVALPERLIAIETGLEREESRLLMAILRQILAPAETAVPSIPVMLEKPEIGSCSQAEEFFLEIAHGRVRRGGRVNLFVDAEERPVLVEKMALGESHSAMAIAPVAVCDVVLPPGALFALRYSDSAAPTADISCGHVFALGTIAEARFLRLTTLAVSPNVRRRAFSAQFDAQMRGDMLSPKTTTLDHLREFARGRLDRG